ncbi:hypothetical protein SK128_016519 [Halocaridina rubra]|uniref:Regulatory protein zeste n=1 Tax=Halocaridina rubra TaxID=373956 RepID=A0AAN8WR81_HALRR
MPKNTSKMNQNEEEQDIIVRRGSSARRYPKEFKKTACPGRRIFTEEERNFLLHLVQDYPILESKSTDTATLQKKWRFWVELTNRFNAAGMNAKRTPEQLRKCWKNMKCKAKRVHQDPLAGEGDNHHTSLNFENDSSPTLLKVEVDPALINQFPEALHDSWEGEVIAKNGIHTLSKSPQYTDEAPGSLTCKRDSAVPSSSASPIHTQHFVEPTREVYLDNNTNSPDFDSGPSSDTLWPVTLRPYQKRKLDAILDQDQKLSGSQLAISRLEEEKNKLQLEILKEQLKNVQKEADLLERKILLTDREIKLTDKKIQYWDRIFKSDGQDHHHVYPNI